MRGRWRWLIVLTITAAFAAGCSSGSGDNGTSDGTRAGATSDETNGASDDDSDDAQSSGNGSGTITVDAGTFDLDLSLCRLESGMITISGETPDGDYGFSVVGIAGAANISFEETGTDNLWTAVGAAPEIDGNSLAFDGSALRNATGGGDPATTMTVELEC